MSNVLHVTPQDLDCVEKRGKYTVCILGCEQYGLFCASAFAGVGFRVICADPDQSLIRKMKKRKSNSSQNYLEVKLKDYINSEILTVTSDLKNAIIQSDMIVVTTPVKIDENRNSDSSNLENSLKQVGEAMRRGIFVFYANVTSIGLMENLIRETLERTSGFKTGQDFGLAYVVGFAKGQKWQAEEIGDEQVIVAANEKFSLEAAGTIFSTVTRKGVKTTINLKAAELAALFSFARRDVTRGLTNELSALCEKTNVDYYETLKLVDFDVEKADFVPSIDDQENKLGTQVLLESADNLGVKLRLPELARQVNEGMVRHAVDLTQGTLRRLGKTLRRSRIAVLGASSPGTSVETFVRMLETKGARINLYYSSGEKSYELDGLPIPKRSIMEAIENSDCIVFLSKEDQFLRLNLKSLRSVMKSPAAILDFSGVFDPEKVENEGFLYCGLGRGCDNQ